MIANLPQRLPVKTAIVFGTHRPTNALATGGSKLRFIEEPVGDGTVPTVSASGRGLTGENHPIERYAIPYGIHSQLFEYKAVRTIMKNILFDRPMPHFACAFERGVFRRGETLGLAVDVRGPRGEVLSDARVVLSIGGKDFPVPRDERAGDYFFSVKMAGSAQHVSTRLPPPRPRSANPLRTSTCCMC